MVTHQLQVRCRPEKVRRSETDVLPLSYTANCIMRIKAINRPRSKISRCVFVARGLSGSQIVEPATAAPSRDCPGNQAASDADNLSSPHCTAQETKYTKLFGANCNTKTNRIKRLVH